MKKQGFHANWWGLYLVVGLAVGLLVLEIRAPLSEGEHQVIEIGIVLLTYGLVELWFFANRQALLREEREQYRNELLRASASRRLKPVARPEPSRNGDGRRPSRGLARLIPGWLLAAFAAVAGFFQQ